MDIYALSLTVIKSFYRGNLERNQTDYQPPVVVGHIDLMLPVVAAKGISVVEMACQPNLLPNCTIVTLAVNRAPERGKIQA